MKKVRLYHPRTGRVKMAFPRDAKILVKLGWQRDEARAVTEPIAIVEPLPDPIEDIVEPEPKSEPEPEPEPPRRSRRKQEYETRDLHAED